MSINGLNSNNTVIQMADGQETGHNLLMSTPPKRIKTDDVENDVGTNEPEYPHDLQKLLLPMWCLLCRTRANSVTSATDHYNSKGHKNKIECWLKEHLPKEDITTCAANEQDNKKEKVYTFHCDLCNIKLTSLAHAKQHYEGRKHRLVEAKKIKSSAAAGKSNSTGQIYDNINNGNEAFRNKLLPPPSPELLSLQVCSKNLMNRPIELAEFTRIFEEENRLQKMQDDLEANAQAHILHCDICDLKLTSRTDAKNHYSGRRHKLVRDKQAQPSGAGNHNKDDKLVPTDPKFLPTCTDDGRFGIGEAFLRKSYESLPHSSDSNISSPVPTPDFWCKICNIGLTSPIDFDIHARGVKHLMKADKLNETKLPKENLNLKYRLPSGAYYCDICDINFNGISILTSHLNGKKHIRRLSLMQNDSTEYDKKSAPATFYKEQQQKVVV